MALVNHWGRVSFKRSLHNIERSRGPEVLLVAVLAHRCQTIWAGVTLAGPKGGGERPGRRRRRSSGHADRPRLLYFVAQTFERVIRSI